MAASHKTVNDIVFLLVEEVGLETATRLVRKLGAVRGNSSFEETMRRVEAALETMREKTKKDPVTR